MSNRTVKVLVEVKVNHIDSVPALLMEVGRVMGDENDCGMLEKQDGDKISWRTSYLNKAF